MGIAPYQDGLVDSFAKMKLPAFATQLRAIAMRAEEQVAEARRSPYSIQRWRDENVWSRHATRARYVLLSDSRLDGLPAAELAVLLAVPFVYEAVLAVAEIRIAAGAAIPDPEAASRPRVYGERLVQCLARERFLPQFGEVLLLEIDIMTQTIRRAGR